MSSRRTGSGARSKWLALLAVPLALLAIWFVASDDAAETLESDGTVIVAAPSHVDLLSPGSQHAADGALRSAQVDPSIREEWNAATASTSAAGTITVIVTDEAGNLVPHARVDARLAGEAAQSMSPASQVYADAPESAGRFVLEGLPLGEWFIGANAPHFVASSQAVELLGDSLEVRIALEQECVASGQVVDARGMPVEGARVIASCPRRGGTARSSDEFGRFRIVLPLDRELVVFAEAKGYARSKPVALLTSAGVNHSGLVLSLQPFGSVSGRVFDSESRPFVQARVRLMRLESAAEFESNRDRHPDELVRTDFANEAGRFRFDNLEAGDYLLSSMGFDVSESRDLPSGVSQATTTARLRVTLAPGEAAVVDLRAKRPGALRIHGVVTRSGTPVGSGSMSYVASTASFADDVSTTSLSDDGTYELFVSEPGSGLLIYCARPQAPLEEWIEYRSYRTNAFTLPLTVPDVKQFERDVALPSGSIRGVVTRDGQPLDDAMLEAVPTAGPALWNQTSAFIGTSKDGAFELAELAPGTYDVIVQGEVNSHFLSFGVLAVRNGVEVRAGARTDGVTIEAGLTDSIVVHARGAIRDQEKLFYTLRDDSGVPLVSGYWQHDESRPRELQLILAGPLSIEANTSSASCEAVAFVNHIGQPTSVTLRFAPAARLTVKTLDSNGQPTSAIVRVLDTAGRERSRASSLDAPLDFDGPAIETHELGPLPPDKYRLVALAPDGREAERDIEWKAGDERVIELRFPER